MLNQRPFYLKNAVESTPRRKGAETQRFRLLSPLTRRMSYLNLSSPRHLPVPCAVTSDAGRPVLVPNELKCDGPHEELAGTSGRNCPCFPQWLPILPRPATRPCNSGRHRSLPSRISPWSAFGRISGSASSAVPSGGAFPRGFAPAAPSLGSPSESAVHASRCIRLRSCYVS